MSAGARDFCKDIVPAPTDAGRSALHLGGFLPMRKSPKNLQGCALWTPEGDVSALFSAALRIAPGTFCH